MLERLKNALPWFGPKALPDTQRVGHGSARQAAVALTYADVARSAAVVVAAWVVRATHGLRVVEVTEGGDEVRGGEVAALLNDRNAYFLSTAIIDRMLFGNAFYDLREPGQIRYIPYGCVKPAVTNKQYMETELPGIEVRKNGGVEKLLPDEFIHIRNGVDPVAPYWGRSPLAG